MHGITGEEIDARRANVTRRLEWACRGGRYNTGNPEYLFVTEKRGPHKFAPKYSSCGDLGHWHFYMAGVRGRWLNQARAGRPWRSGLNVGLLAAQCLGKNYGADSSGVAAWADFGAEPGDVLIVKSYPGNEHVMVVHEYDRATHQLRTAEFGQPGGALKMHTLVCDPKVSTGGAPKLGTDLRPLVGARRIHWHISFAEVLRREAEAGTLTDEQEVPWS